MKFKGVIKHDLDKLKEELSRKRVTFTAGEKENFNRVRSAWSSEMRYDATARRRKDAERVCEAAAAIFDWAGG